MHFVYPYTVEQSEDGPWQVRFPDVPEALTEGTTEAEAHELAADALVSALGGLEKLRRDIPAPSKPRHRDVVVVPGTAVGEAGAVPGHARARSEQRHAMKKLGKAENEVRRMLDLDHQTKIGALESALQQLGKQITTEVKLAA